MRRALLILVAAVTLSLGAAPAAYAFDGASSGGTVLAQSSDSSGPAEAPSIIPSPNERGRNNIGGLVVGVVLLGGWGLLGFALYRQAQRRRAAGTTAHP